MILKLQQKKNCLRYLFEKKLTRKNMDGLSLYQLGLSVKMDMARLHW